MTCIQASFDTLLSQASMTARQYMSNAADDIDKTFGEGFAKKNPQLVAAYMQVACADFNASSTAKVIGEAIEELAHAVRAA